MMSWLSQEAHESGSSPRTGKWRQSPCLWAPPQGTQGGPLAPPRTWPRQGPPEGWHKPGWLCSYLHSSLLGAYFLVWTSLPTIGAALRRTYKGLASPPGPGTPLPGDPAQLVDIQAGPPGGLLTAVGPTPAGPSPWAQQGLWLPGEGEHPCGHASATRKFHTRPMETLETQGVGTADGKALSEPLRAPTAAPEAAEKQGLRPW